MIHLIIKAYKAYRQRKIDAILANLVDSRDRIEDMMRSLNVMKLVLPDSAPEDFQNHKDIIRYMEDEIIACILDRMRYLDILESKLGIQ